jgi:hypothetical protein
MPEIQVTDDQLERLEALRAELGDGVGKYGHVRMRDAVEYLLDRHAAGDDVDAKPPTADGSTDPVGDAGTAADAADEGASASTAAPRENGDAADAGAAAGAEGDDGDDGDDGDGMVNAMMNLLSAHDDKWREAAGGDSRYEVDLPGGDTETARTRDDVRALLFKHYR